MKCTVHMWPAQTENVAVYGLSSANPHPKPSSAQLLKLQLGFNSWYNGLKVTFDVTLTT